MILTQRTTANQLNTLRHLQNVANRFCQSKNTGELAIQHQIPILFFDNIGKAKALLWNPYFENLATLRRNQIKFAESTLAT